MANKGVGRSGGQGTRGAGGKGGARGTSGPGGKGGGWRGGDTGRGTVPGARKSRPGPRQPADMKRGGSQTGGLKRSFTKSPSAGEFYDRKTGEPASGRTYDKKAHEKRAAGAAAGRPSARKPGGQSSGRPPRASREAGEGYGGAATGSRGGGYGREKPAYGKRPGGGVGGHGRDRREKPEYEKRPGGGPPGIKRHAKQPSARTHARPAERPAERPTKIYDEPYEAAHDEATGEQYRPPFPDNKVFGVNSVAELIASGGRTIDALYVDKEKGGKRIGEIIADARRLKLTVKFAPKRALDDMALGMRHQGVVAVTTPKQYAVPEALMAEAMAKGPLPLIVILDGVEDPQNLGSVIRSAESAGVDGVVIPEHRAAHLSSAVARSSAGALEHMAVAKAKNLATFMAMLKENGFWIVGLDEDAKQDYDSFDMNVPLAIVLGSEGKGLRPLIRKSCDAVVSLPMMGQVGSLNVSVAAGVVLYEALRQRKAAAGGAGGEKAKSA